MTPANFLGRWKIDADGRVLKGLYDVWSQSVTQTQLCWPAECPLDASLVVVWAYLLAFRDPAAREQLDGRGWTVDGGYLMRLVIPQRGPDGQMQAPPLPNFIDLYLQMLEHMLSQRSQ